jgi:hypothetical protein
MMMGSCIDDEYGHFVWVPMIDIIAEQMRQEEEEDNAFAEMIAKRMHVHANKPHGSKFQRYDPFDEFATNIPCVHQDSDGCDYKLVRNNDTVIGYLCREHVNDYVRSVKSLKLDVREIRMERIQKIDR